MSELHRHIQRLITANMDLQHLGFTVWRISTRINLIHNTRDPAYLIPISIISGTPSLGSECPQVPGNYTKYGSQIDLTPELDCIFVVPLASS
jgi:hypothetical protein